jgi:hypothetical protein
VVTHSEQGLEDFEQPSNIQNTVNSGQNDLDGLGKQSVDLVDGHVQSGIDGVHQWRNNLDSGRLFGYFTLQKWVNVRNHCKWEKVTTYRVSQYWE